MYLIDVIDWSTRQPKFVQYMEEQNIILESMISVSAKTIAANLHNLKIEIIFTFLSSENLFKTIIAELSSSDSEFIIVKLILKDYLLEFEDPGTGIAQFLPAPGLNVYENRMPAKYKPRENAIAHFITSAFVGWIDVFSREYYKEIFSTV